MLLQHQVAFGAKIANETIVWKTDNGNYNMLQMLVDLTDPQNPVWTEPDGRPVNVDPGDTSSGPRRR